MVGHGEPIPKGFVRRPRPVYPEFVCHCSWWPNQIHQRNGDPDMVYLWIPRKDDVAYRRTHERKRFCQTYRGESCVEYRKRVIVAAKC